MTTAVISPAAELLAAKLKTRDEAAEFLGVRPQTLALWASTKRYPLPYIRVGRSVRYRQSDLERFLELRTVGSFGDDAE